MQTTNRRELRDWFIITAIILLGFLCVIFAGILAVRLSPRWQLSADMGSHIDPNSDFLTNRPIEYIEPLDESILTPPSWIDFFQTPGASNSPQTPLPTRTVVVPPTSTPPSAVTRTATSTASPTGTGFVYYPTGTATNTSRPIGTKTSTPTATPSWTPLPADADIGVTKTDGVATYAAGGTLTYTIIVTNHGPANVIGAMVRDTIPTQILNWTWTCAAQNGGATGCTPAANGNGTFTDMVNLPNGASIEYTVTANVRPDASGSLSNTAEISVPVSYSDKNTSNDSATDVDLPSVDMQITKTDGVATYSPGGTLTYNVTVTNNSTFMVNNAEVVDTFSAQIANATWSCTPDAGATCTANGSGNISDLVDIPAGLSVRYTITATVSNYSVGNLTNTITVTAPSANYGELDFSNNTATDTDACTSTEPDIGPPDGTWVELMPGNSMVIILSPAIHANGDVGVPDFVYFERLNTLTSVDLDWVQVEISADGINWYQVFYWGDPGGNPDTNTNVDISDPAFSAICPTEADNCNIPTASLYNNTGVTIDVDGLVPAGYYAWIRITSPPGGDGDSSNIDSIQPYYP